ncbi:MAG: 3-deoxy-manno-octulosonate cytidylyltransferase [Desulfovibrionaceae bacterium]
MTSPRFYAVIPARYNSSRFPGKPLADILGKPMIWRVHQRASLCGNLARVAVATDDERILSVCRELGVEALMTSADHASGTERVLEAARKLGVAPGDVVVNVQGDEPALAPEMIDELIAPFDDPAVRVTTLCARLDATQAANPDRVKVVLDKRGDALYFSRAPIPYDRDGEGAERLLHLGLYAFRMEALELFAGLPPGRLERTERLEQLRLLENGVPIRVVCTEHRSFGVDRPEDIEAITTIIMENKA